MAKPLNSTDTALEAAATITEADVERAKETARRHGKGTRLASMLDAEQEILQDGE